MRKRLLITASSLFAAIPIITAGLALASVQSSPISVSIAPASASVQINGTQQFTATVQNASNPAVRWSLSGSGCAGAACGRLSSTSSNPVTYTAPGAVPNPATVTVKATSVADRSQSASASVTIVQVCTGTAFAGVPVDVTNLISVPPAPGVTVRLLTGWDGSAPTNTANYPTNSDVIVHSSLLNVLIFNHGLGKIVGAYASPDGTGQQVAATTSGLHVRPAPDGKGFVQPGGPSGTDPQWTDLTRAGSCQTVPLASKGYPNLPTNNGVPTSLPVSDPAHNNLHLVTWAPDGFLHRVYEDGTFVCDGGAPACPGISPPDGFPVSQGFHRLRENNKFPHWLHYTRENDSVPRLWLYNFDTGQSCYLPHGNHDDNSLDGTMYAVGDPGQVRYYVFKLFDASGNLLSNVGCSGAGPVTIDGIAQGASVCTASSPGWCVNTGNLPNQLPGSPGVGAPFCSFSFDSTFLFCTEGPGSPFPGHQANEFVLFTVTPDTGFASVPTSATVSYLTPTDGAQTGAYEGIPVPNAGWKDGAGNIHTYFRSDKEWADLARTVPFTYNPNGAPQLFEVIFQK